MERRASLKIPLSSSSPVYLPLPCGERARVFNILPARDTTLPPKAVWRPYRASHRTPRLPLVQRDRTAPPAHFRSTSTPTMHTSSSNVLLAENS
jgi:hypothetical protein